MFPRAIKLCAWTIKHIHNDREFSTYTKWPEKGTERERLSERNKWQRPAQRAAEKKVIILGDDKFLCAIDGFMMETE